MSLPPVNISGISSGIDTNALVSALMGIERLGLTRLNTQKSSLVKRQDTYKTLNTELTNLRTAAKALTDKSALLTQKATPVDTKILDATATGAAVAATYNVTVQQRATASVLNGTTDVGKAIDPATAMNGSNSLGATLTGGTISINGTQITVNATDSLNTFLANVQTAMGGASKFTTSYDSATDKVELKFKNNNTDLVLGSGSDTSNILSMLKLSSDGTTSSAISSSALGSLDPSAVLNAAGENGARAKTLITDGGSGSGKFTVNGVEIAFNSGTESLSAVLSRINSSTAGVTATYDKLNDKIVLTNKSAGTTGIFVQDVTGNFAAALGLTGTTTLGQAARITIAGVNGGNPISSSDNLFTEAETGMVGLSLNVKASTGSTEVTVAADTEATTAKFQAFVDAYNKVSTFIQEQSKVTGTGTTATRGPLNGEQDARILMQTLRSSVGAVVPGLASGPSTLAGIGISTTGADPKLTLDKVKLTAAIQNNPSVVQSIAADATHGVMVKLSSFIGTQTDVGTGVLAQKPAQYDAGIARLNSSITNFNLRLEMKETQLRGRFAAMERALASLNQDGLSGILSALNPPN